MKKNKDLFWFSFNLLVLCLIATDILNCEALYWNIPVFVFLSFVQIIYWKEIVEEEK